MGIEAIHQATFDFMKAFSDVRDKVLVAIKHEKAAYDRKVERCAKNRRTYRTKHPKRYKGRKRGRKAKWRKKDFKPSTMKNGESKMDFLRRSFYTLRTCPDKWSDEQWERMDILFDEFPELKEAFDLKEEFRKLYWSKRDKEEYKDSLPAMEERNALKETVRENLHLWFDHVKKSKSPGMKTFMRTIKEREEDLLNYYETFVTNASAESLNSGIKGFRAELHGISNLPFFFYRVCKIYG